LRSSPSQRSATLGWFAFGAVVLLAASLGAAGCADEPVVELEVPTEDPILVVVGEQTVAFSLFLEGSRSRTAPGEFPRSGSGFEAFRDRLVWEIAFEEVLLLEAEARGISVDDSDVDGARLQLVAQLEDPELVPELINERYGGDAAWRNQVRRRLLTGRAEEAVRGELTGAESFDAQTIADARLRFQDHLTRPPRIRASQIFAATVEAIGEPESELAGGAPFAEVAKKHDALDMGWMSTDQAPELLVDATEGLAIGKATEVLRSAQGYHIFAVTGREPAARMTGEAGKTELERLLRLESVDSQFKAWLEQRSEALQVSIHEGNVAEVRCCRLGLPYWGRAQQEEQ